MIAGVAAGIARHLGLPVVAVRIAFVVLAGFNGVGAVLYAVFWAVLRVDRTRPASRRHRGGQFLLFAGLGIAALAVSAITNGGGARAVLGWLVAIVAIGAGIIWHQADPARRRELGEDARAPWLATLLSGNDRRVLALRFGGGGVLVLIGVVGIAVAAVPVQGGLSVLLTGLLFALLAVSGVAVVVGPLLWRAFGQLRTEREARIREQERAEVAAMVHDQVLHTLAMIQRNHTDSKVVLRLARAQERTLRNWLYKPTASPAERFGAAMEEAAAEVEDTFAITVDTVVVGDCPVDERIAALVAAAREAMVNAGKHAKVQTVSLYAEVEDEQVSVFVRDRGVGFDPAAVDDDRHGVRGSIVGRMTRHGGGAEIRSTPGEGTEVRLTMPRKPGKEGTPT